MESILVSTYRCNAHCHMCNTWQHPTSAEQELDPKYYERFPNLEFLNITGGEPFLREDLEDIVRIVKPKCKRICISTNGYFTDRIVALAKKFNGDIGVRISIEGLPKANDELRGLTDGFDHGIHTLLQLKRMGMKDIGFGITIRTAIIRMSLNCTSWRKGWGLSLPQPLSITRITSTNLTMRSPKRMRFRIR